MCRRQVGSELNQNTNPGKCPNPLSTCVRHFYFCQGTKEALIEEERKRKRRVFKCSGRDKSRRKSQTSEDESASVACDALATSLESASDTNKAADRSTSTIDRSRKVRFAASPQTKVLRFLLNYRLNRSARQMTKFEIIEIAMISISDQRIP